MKLSIEEQSYPKVVLKEEEGNDVIAKYLQENRSFMVSRAGGTETKIISCLIHKKETIPDHLRNAALVLSGIFPNDERTLQKFAYHYADCIRKVDLMGIWGIADYDWLVKTYCPDAQLTRLWGLEPHHHPNPWSRHLENKNVLVVHPFEQSIKNNYANRTKLFSNPKILPAFNLKTIKADQNLNNKGSDYFETIKKTQEKISKVDFDVAIIGCGASGLPLASFVKSELNKAAVHLGGATQILFGIRGKRWCPSSSRQVFFSNSSAGG